MFGGQEFVKDGLAALGVGEVDLVFAEVAGDGFGKGSSFL